MKRNILLIIVALCVANSYAQQAATYTLKSCLEKGLDNNYSLKIVRNDEQVAILSC